MGWGTSSAGYGVDNTWAGYGWIKSRVGYGVETIRAGYGMDNK